MRRFQHILDSGTLTKGQYLVDFEDKLGSYLGVDNAMGVSSCTTGLILALKALKLTGEVILPSFTFSATAAAVVANGLTPVFVDCDPDTFNIDPSAVELAITPNTSAIIAVHIFGNPAPVDDLELIAAKRNLKLIFDAAHGFGSLLDGRTLGANGDVEVFSCSPTKLLVSGEGGVVATNIPEIAESVRMGREYGNPGDYNTRFAGLNGRMSEFHAAVGIESLSNLERNAEKRNQLAKLYKQQLSNLPGLHFQKVLPGNRCSFKDFGVAIDSQTFGLGRDEFAEALNYEGIQTRPYYDPPVHRQTAYARYYTQGDGGLPVTEKLAESILCLPMSSLMTELLVEKICKCIFRIHTHRHDLQERSKIELIAA